MRFPGAELVSADRNDRLNNRAVAGALQEDFILVSFSGWFDVYRSRPDLTDSKPGSDVN